MRINKIIILRYFVLFVIPALLLYLGFSYVAKMQCHYYNSIDPEYLYLFNGLNLAQLKLTLGHIDHPGTPLQWLVAIVIRICHFFNSDQPLVEDVLKNPEFYLIAVDHVIIFLNSIAVFITGIVILNFSENILLGLLFQLSPFVSIVTMQTLYRVMPESMLIFTTLLTVVLIFCYTTRKENISSSDFYLFAFSAICAWGIAIKLTFIPIAIIPLVMLKKKLRFILITVLLFFLFAFPASLQIDDLFNWTKKLLVHSGRYGAGPETVVDIDSIVPNIKLLLDGAHLFSVFYFFTGIALLIFGILRATSLIQGDHKLKLLSAVFFVMTFQLFIVAKHFAYHYMVPIHVLSVFACYIVISILSSFNKTVNHLSNYFYAGLVIAIVYFNYPSVYQVGDWNREHAKSINKTIDLLNKNNNIPKIIVHEYYGCSYKEYALMVGKIWSGMRADYAFALNKMYPQTYFCTEGSKTIYSWGEWGNEINLRELLSSNPKILVYFANSDSTMVNSFYEFSGLQKICAMNLAATKKLFYNSETGESAVEITSHANKNALNLNYETILCNFDTTSPDKKHFVCSLTGKTLGESEKSQSIEKVFSGKNSIKLTRDEAFQPIYTFDTINEGDFIKVHAWRCSESNNGTIVASANNSEEFYAASEYIESTKEINSCNWVEVSLSFTLDKKPKDGKINIYLWNNGKADVYFDDVKIELLGNKF